jgi:hypothetical protein
MRESIERCTMKWNVVLTFTLLLVVTTFAFYASVQSQIDKNQDVYKIFDTGRSGSAVAAGGLRPPGPGESIVIQPVTREDGTINFYESIHFPSPSFMRGRRLRIEMQDGTVQEFELLKVKSVTVEPVGSLRLGTR